MQINNFFEKVSNNNSWNDLLKLSITKNSDKILKKISKFTKNESAVGLIVGKVQSGKTSNIIGLSAMAFDQGYKLVIVLFSDQKSLFSQNYERVNQAFSNLNNNVKVINFSEDGDYSLLRKSQYDSFFDQDKKIVICSMKHKKYTKEIYNILHDTKFNSTIPIIVDDEGDDITQNNDKQKFDFIDRRSPNNEAVVNLKKMFQKSCYLTVTATPQAPLLLQSFQDLAIDFVNLIEPGPGYIGLEDYHSGEDKNLSSVITDYEALNNKYQLPDSFYESFLFFLLGAFLRTDSGKDKHSMMVHSSKKNNEQTQIVHKIETLLNHFYNIDTSSDIFKNSKTKDIYKIFESLYKKDKEFLNIKQDCETLFKEIVNLSKEVSLIELNHKQKMKNLNKQIKNVNYYIVVGGDMLDRGLTIEGLAVNYFTREPKKGQIDTMLQRARWFGYKSEYRKFCRVYITQRVSNMFSSIIETEEDLWSQLRIIEDSEIKVKDIDINIFVPNEDLMPASKSKVKLLRTSLKPWYVQKFFSIHKKHQEINKKLIDDFLLNYDSLPYKFKQHKKYQVKTKEIINMLANIKFSDSEESVKDFIIKTLNLLKLDQSTPVDLIDMRYSTGEERSLISESGSSLKHLNNLMQGRNDDYPGDRYIIENNFMLQIHRVALKDSYQSYEIGDEVIAFSFGIPEKYLRENFFKKENIKRPLV